MKKKDKFKYNAWNEHLKNTKELTYYSVRRMDLLIISISGVGIYIIFETLREFKTGNIEIEDTNLLLTSGLFFLISIVSNFFSQMTSYHANKNEQEYTNLQIDMLEGEKIDNCEEKKSTKR